MQCRCHYEYSMIHNNVLYFNDILRVLNKVSNRCDNSMTLYSELCKWNRTNTALKRCKLHSLIFNQHLNIWEWWFNVLAKNVNIPLNADLSYTVFNSQSGFLVLGTEMLYCSHNSELDLPRCVLTLFELRSLYLVVWLTAFSCLSKF